jgi:serine phosphatase RsbU (regulator of sigma subunit)
MKLKITNPWIPASLMLAAITGVIITLISNEDSTFDTACSIFAITCALLLPLVYFPILTVKLFQGKIENKTKVVNNIGIFSVGLIVAGSFMRLYNMPGGGAVAVLSATFFYLNFLPSWYAVQYKETDKAGKFFYFLFCTCLGLQILSYQFKVMHWYGADFMRMLSLYTALFTLLPIGIILLFKKDKVYFTISHKFLFGFMIAYILSGWVAASLANKMFANNSTSYSSFEKNILLYQTKNKFLYDAISNSKAKDSTFLLYKSKVSDLKNQSDKIYRYIQELKAELIMVTDHLTELNPDSVTYNEIQNKTDLNSPTHVLIGPDETQPANGEYTAVELKEKLKMYIQQTTSLLPEEGVLEFKQSIPFDFSDVEEESGVNSWEVYNFYHLTLSSVYSTLTNFQANVRYMEMNALNELFNKANAGNKDNMAAQLAELATKYETTKKEKEISILQKDKELNDVKIQAKDVEISAREKTITYFIFAIIAFGVLMIFVIRSNVLRKQANKELANQKNLVEEKNHEITDSINYAKRIQSSLLPPLEEIHAALPNSFVLFKPKDIVSGDFYWFHKTNDSVLLAAADCTGHGVPGAFMSMLNSDKLNEAVSSSTDVSKILQLVNIGLKKALRQSEKEDSTRDGMDIALVSFNKETTKLEYSGANRPIWIIRNGKKEIEETKATKIAIGGLTEDEQTFTKHAIDLQKGDTVYIFTDGFADQFSPDDKKLMTKKFKETLYLIQDKNMEEQKAFLNTFIENWKGNMEQTDDILVIGVRV